MRPEFDYIINLVEPGSRVLDLGCGEGDLLKALQKRKRARVQGIELSDTAIQACMAKGLFVYHGDLNEGLADFNDESVDYVILTSTIQVLYRPDFLIKEAARVGKKCIISVPNFGYWRVRFQLMFRGVMPVTSRLPYDWYDSPNIHLTTIRDFRRFCREHNLEILNEIDTVIGERCCRRVRALPNFFADYGIFLLRRQNSSG
ncbi:MAG: methionine biosynthesis protein MetW [Armatimonadetes bacterium RBG_16_58_9]|nr:MAG: methionine biosynthesis protein MetW [Armatimonadetes bacterium RBG_16_58_9]